MICWNDVIKQEKEKEYFRDICNFLINEEKQNHIVFPKKENIFKAFMLCPLDKVKVVILGQDPYHNYGQADGLSFSVPDNTELPASLRNIFKELSDDMCVTPSSGNLNSWALQGVLLINTIFTVRAHQPHSHKDIGWLNFTKNILSTLNAIDKPIVFILWGKHASDIASPILNNANHLIIKSCHPSPLSAHRGFFGSKPFSKANTFLVTHKLSPINW